jgi:PAS domain S-box-containing protein
MKVVPSKYLVDGKYSIKDLVDLEELRALFQAFTDSMGFTIGFLSNPELEILIATGWRKICTQYHRNCPLAAQRCRISNARLVNHLKRPGQIVIEACENGLVDCATPIIIKGKKIAILATGQVLLKPPDLERFRKQARQYGIPEAAYLKALQEIPVISSGNLKNATNFLGQLAHMITRMGYARLQQKELAGQLTADIEKRGKIAKELREAEYQKALVLNNATEIIARHDRHHRLQWANEAYLKATGLSLAELKGKKCYEVWGLKKLCKNCPVSLAVKDGKPHAEELMPENQPHWPEDQGSWLVRAAPVKDNAGKVVGAIEVAVDISKQKAAEKMSRITEARLATTLESVGDAVIATDLRGRITFFNKIASRLTGWKEEKAKGQSLSKVFRIANETTGQKAKNPVAKVLRKGMIVGLANHTVLISQNGRRIPIDDSAAPIRDEKGRMIGVVLVFHDVTTQRQTENALKSSEERFRTIYENSPVLMDAFDAKGRCVLWNKECQKVFGWTIKEINAHKEPLALFYPDPIVRKQVLKTVSKEPSQIFKEWRPVTKKGKELVVMWANFRLPGGLVMNLGYDITERKRASEALSQSEERLRVVLDNSIDLVYRRDLKTGYYDYFSSAVEQHTGFTADELIGTTAQKRVLPRIHPEDLKCVQKALHNALIGRGAGGSLEYRFRHKDGKYRWFSDRYTIIKDAAGHPAYWSGVSRDITDQMRAKELLQQREAFLTSIVDNQSGMVWLKDKESRFLAVNKVFAKMAGKKNPEDIVGKTDLDVWPPKMANGYRADDRKVMRSRKPITVEELISAKGVARWHETFKTPVFDSNGKVIGTTGYARDITERRRAEELLRESEGRFRKLIEQSPVAMAIVSMDGVIEYINEKAIEVFGYLPTDIPTMERWWVQAYPDEVYRKKVIAGWMGRVKKAVLKGPEIRGAEYTVTCKDRTVKTMFISGAHISGKVFVLFEDITELKKEESSIKLSARRDEALLKLNQMESSTLKEITDFALEAIVRLTESKIGYLAFLNEDGSVLTMHSWSKTAMKECAIDDKPIEYLVKKTGLWGEAVRQRKPIITNDYAAPNPFKKGYPKGHVNVTRHMNAPIFSGGRIVIVAGVGNKVEPYNKNDVTQLTLIMESMWRLLERKKAEQAIARRVIFDELMVKILARFAGTSVAGMDLAINKALHETGRFLSAERSFVALIDKSKKSWSISHEWCGPGVASFLSKVQDVPFGVMRWSEKEILAGRVVKINDLSDYPKQASAELHFHKSQRIQSAICMPMIGAHGEILGYIGLHITNMKKIWGDDDLTRLRILSNAIAEFIERRQTEEELQQREERLRLQFQRMPVACILFSPEFRVMSWNPAAEKIFGYKSGEVLGRHPYGLIVPSSAQLLVKPIWRRLLRGDATANLVNENTTKSGKTILCKWTNTPLRSEDGKILGVLSMAEDITRQKKAESDLKVAHFSISHSSNPVFWVDSRGKFLYANHAASRTFGYSAKELLAMTVHDLNPDFPASRWKAHFEELRKKKSMVFGERGRTKQGRTFPAEIVVNYAKFEGKEYSFVSVYDITERKLAEEKVRKAQLQYQQLVENAKDGIFTVDLEGNFVLTNPEFRSMLGYSQKEFKKLNILDTYPEENKREALERIRRLRKGTMLRFERPMKRKDGELLFIEAIAWKSSDGAIEAFVRDISERKKAENAVKEHRRQLLQVIDTVPHMIFAKDQKGRFLLANRAVAEAYKTTPKALIGIRRQDIHSNRQELKAFLQGDKQVLESGKPLLVSNEPFTDNFGRKHIVQTIKIPFQMIGIKDMCILGVSVDVTEQRKVEEFRNDIVRTVSHELRTPLSIQKEGISLLRDGVVGAVNVKQKEILETVMRSIDRLARMITSLLDISTIETGKIKLVQKMASFTDLVNDVALGFKGYASEKNIDLRVKLPGHAVEVLMDPDKITQVLSNLMDNAIKFTPEGGVVEISLTPLRDVVECEVRDSGIGIASENIGKLFEKFQQFSRTAGPGEKGFGLGLSIAKGIVELHEGRIWIKSELGKGTRAAFSLPFHQKPGG